MHAGENLHGRVARIVAHKLLINLEDAFQLAIENLPVDVRQVEIDHRLTVNAEIVLIHDLEDGSCRHIAGYEIPVLRIPLFQEVPTLTLGNGLGITLVAWSLRHPNASAFAARRLRHEAQLIFTGN